MAIETVVGKIDLTANEPLRPGRFPFEDLVPLAKPMKLASDLAPKLLGVFFGLAIELLVLFEALYVCLLAELRGSRKDSSFLDRKSVV